MTAGPARPVHPRAGRWLLLGVLIIGLLAMLFLSGRDSAGHHRVLTPGPATVGAQLDAAALPAAQTTVHEPSGDGHAFLAGWSVLLLVAATGAVAGALRRRHTEHRPAALQSVRAGGLRGPPPALSRRALCVDRI